MKFQVLKKLVPALALIGSFFAVTSSSPKAVAAAEDTTVYVDLTSETTQLTGGNTYLFGTPYVESTGTFMYLMAFGAANTGTYARVPCLAGDDAAHPYGITEANFRKYCIQSTIFPMSIDTGFSLVFEDCCDEMTYDTTSNGLATTTSSPMMQSPSYTLDSSNKITAITWANWEVVLTANSSGEGMVASFKHFDSTADSGAITALQVYSPSSDVLMRNTAFGFSQAVTANKFDATNALAGFQALPANERVIYGHDRVSAYTSGTTAGQAVQKIIIDSHTTYGGYTNYSYRAAAPSPSIDYANDCFTGLSDEETYTVSYDSGTAGTSNIPAENGTFPLSGFANNASYDCTGRTIEFATYSYYAALASEAVSLTVDARAAAPSTTVTPVTAPISLTETINQIFDTEIHLTPEANTEFLCTPISGDAGTFNTMETFAWVATPDFTTCNDGEKSAINPETSYAIYKRTVSTTAPNSLPAVDGNGAYLFATITTLSALEGMRARILIANYAAYSTAATALGTGAYLENLNQRLNTFETAIKAATTTDDLGVYLLDTAFTSYTFAQTQDSVVTEFKKNTLVLSSDSTATQKLVADTIAAINALSFDAGDDVTKAQTIASDALWKVTSYRYRESKANDLVAYFNNEIFAKATSLSSEKQDALWQVFDDAFQQIIVALGTDLATTQTAVDALVSSAQTALTAKLAEVSA